MGLKIGVFLFVAFAIGIAVGLTALLVTAVVVAHAAYGLWAAVGVHVLITAAFSVVASLLRGGK